jgi:endonuclease/exonuclease/phosphatase family metal-dependent hydrolase
MHLNLRQSLELPTLLPRHLLRWVMPSAIAVAIAAGCGSEPAPDMTAAPPEAAGRIRVALFNIRELRVAKIEQTDTAGTGLDPQLRAAANIIQRVRPDVLVLQEIDLYLEDGATYGTGAELDRHGRRFVDAYLETGDNPIDYPFTFAAPSNTGLLTGLDLDRDGHVATDSDRGDRVHGSDSFGYGTYPGEYAMAVLSRRPLLSEEVRTFQSFLWRDLPGHHIPPGVYSPEALAIARLSSKSHWDLPVRVGAGWLHLLISHPTPPGFDGDEDRNGRRNFDEIKLWTDYIDGNDALVDDRGRRGGYDSEEPFLIIGDLNAQPDEERSIYDGEPAIAQLLEHPRLQDTGPLATSQGALQGRPAGPPDYPERSTAEFRNGIRVDYVLPSTNLEVLAGGVFWPAPEEDPEGHAWAEAASDHRLVWLDLIWRRDGAEPATRP